MQETVSSEQNAAIPEKNHTAFWSPMRQVLLGAFISIITTIGSVFLVVELTQNNDEKQEKLAVLRLLEIAKADVIATGFLIEDFENRQGKANGNSDTIINSWTKFGITLPYPILFTKVMTDERVLVNLSTTSLHTVYSLEKQLGRVIN